MAAPPEPAAWPELPEQPATVAARTTTATAEERLSALVIPLAVMPSAAEN